MAKPGLNTKNGSGVAVATSNAGETVAATLAGVSPDTPGAVVTLDGTLDITSGLTVTAVTIRIRRGVDATGVLVGTPEVPPIAASTRGTFAIQAVDQPGEVVGQSYVLTVQQTGGTSAGTVNSAVLTATY